MSFFSSKSNYGKSGEGVLLLFVFPLKQPIESFWTDGEQFGACESSTSPFSCGEESDWFESWD